MEIERVPLDLVALGGKVESFSDEFFAEAFHLLLVEVFDYIFNPSFVIDEAQPAPSLKGQFGPKGALYSGWETRRHNPTHDWCIIKLGTTGTILGFDIDTTHFNGNEAPEVSVDALYQPDDQPAPQSDGANWSEILPRSPLGPSSKHLFKINPTEGLNYVKLNMYPDGGIARFRVYGLVSPVFPADLSVQLDLAHVFSGGRVVYTSDQHFGVGSNLILPGRGKDMGDGWETKRSRHKGHKDWVIIKLEFPESCELRALSSEELNPVSVPEEDWTLILPRTKLGPHRQHFFQLHNVDGKAFTHVKVTIYPDGGIKRIRIVGRRTGGDITAPVPPGAASETAGANIQQGDAAGPILPALPLTPEAFAPFGQVVQAYSDLNAVPSPRATRITGANQGTAVKFHKLALLESSYPADTGATSGLSIYRCKPIEVAPGGQWEVKLLERHPCTNQAFIPMGGGEGLDSPGETYLVIVAKNGADDKPDLQSMRAFIATAGQGIVYNTGIWHHPMAVIDRTMDFTCVETQVGNGDKLDCEIVELDGSAGFSSVQLPKSDA
ncbi:allantoicase [Fomitopsis serialis]|uniref:allantoicase n=1 Tax=Fomitopsis serialis TaxID=139415 RepID=UPI00200743AA|nr:allantoicase [Neoantrodia serialis]KAH9935328.1 allantoicase [Neoantrodia serialis]